MVSQRQPWLLPERLRAVQRSRPDSRRPTTTPPPPSRYRAHRSGAADPITDPSRPSPLPRSDWICLDAGHRRPTPARPTRRECRCRAADRPLLSELALSRLLTDQFRQLLRRCHRHPVRVTTGGRPSNGCSVNDPDDAGSLTSEVGSNRWLQRTHGRSMCKEDTAAARKSYATQRSRPQTSLAFTGNNDRAIYTATQEGQDGRPFNQTWTWSGLPARASSASPSASPRVGCACTNRAASAGLTLRLTRSCASPINSPVRSPTM